MLADTAQLDRWCGKAATLKTMKHKRQHYIPASYLQAWCDPESPPGQTPYVWIFSKDGSQVRNKSPEKIFFEKDMYTIHTDDGGRDLKLEYNLSKLEHEFVKLRKNKLNKRLPLSSREFLLLCMFTAAMFGRTKAYEEHWRQQWKKMLDFGEQLQEQLDKASPEERTRIASATSTPHIKEENILTLEDVRRLAEQPIQSSLSDTVTGLSPLLFKTPFRILETTEAFGFITSDAPCVWFDPAQYQAPKPFGAGGLVSPTIEITMPLSPTQMLFLGKTRYLRRIYMRIEDENMIDNLNKRTRLSAHEYCVTNRSSLRPGWF